MRYLCLIHRDAAAPDAMPAGQAEALDASRREFDQALRRSGHCIAAEALHPAREAACVRAGPGDAPVILDGAFTGTNERLSGFYLLEARDLNEAVRIAAQFPGARQGTVEIRPVRDAPNGARIER